MTQAIALALLTLVCSMVGPAVVLAQTRSMRRAVEVWKSWIGYMGAMSAFGAVIWFLAWLGS
jgi:hypothetical protein